MIFFGENMLRHAVAEFSAHYLTERNHQGLENRLIEPPENIREALGEVTCQKRLGGLLKYYHRKAA